MANRSYLYALRSNPETASDLLIPEGLSEWNYGLPLSYEILASSAPKICRSVIANGLIDANENTPVYAVYAVYAECETGKRRLRTLLEILRFSASQERIPSSFRRLLSVFGVPFKDGLVSPLLLEAIEVTEEFLDRIDHPFLLLETVELDVMSTSDPAELRGIVERTRQRCEDVGAAIDALPNDLKQAHKILSQPAKSSATHALMNLRIDDHFDRPRPGERYLGLSYWSNVLAFDFSEET